MNFQNLLNKIDQYNKPITQLKEVKTNAPLTELDLKSIKKLSGLNENCGMPPMMGGMPSSPPVTMNVSVNASGTDNIRDLLDLLKGGDMMGDKDDAVSGPVGAVLSIGGEEEPGEEDNPLDMLAHGDEDDRGEQDGEMFGDEEEVEMEEYANSPEEAYAGDEVTKMKGNDLHSHGGNEAPKVNGGGNPYTVTSESLKSQLHNLYQEVRNRDITELAKWRDPKYKDKLYTQEPRDYDQYDYGDDDYYNPKPDDYPGEKNLKGGGEFDHNDPLRRGQGIGRSGIKNNINLSGKRKGLPSRDQITSLKGSIRDVHGNHPRPNLPK